MIELCNVWHHYGVQPVLRDVSMRIETGELVCVMGPNGMGKSTLLALVGGLMVPIKGHVAIDGQRRRSSVEAEREIRQKLMYLPDEPYLPPERTGREFMLAVGRLWGVDEERLFEHCEQLLDVFDLREKADAVVSSYSAGQRKKVSLCTALIADTPILVLDEPFSGGLDSAGLHAMQSILKHLAARQDRTVLMAVPVPELVEPVARRIAILDHGKLVAFDTSENLRREAGVDGSLADVLAKLIHTTSAEATQRYIVQVDRKGAGGGDA